MYIAFKKTKILQWCQWQIPRLNHLTIVVMLNDHPCGVLCLMPMRDPIQRRLSPWDCEYLLFHSPWDSEYLLFHSPWDCDYLLCFTISTSRAFWLSGFPTGWNQYLSWPVACPIYDFSHAHFGLFWKSKIWISIDLITVQVRTILLSSKVKSWPESCVIVIRKITQILS